MAPRDNDPPASRARSGMTTSDADQPIPALPIPTREDIVRAAEVLYPAEEVPAVLAVLARYRGPAWSKDALRVQRAVLVLSEGRFEKLEEFEAEAERDFRNVLYWYEYTKPGVALRFALEARLAAAQRRE